MPCFSLILKTALADNVIARWFRALTGDGSLLKDGQNVENILPRLILPTIWAQRSLPSTPEETCYSWIDGSYRNWMADHLQQTRRHCSRI